MEISTPAVLILALNGAMIVFSILLVVGCYRGIREEQALKNR